MAFPGVVQPWPMQPHGSPQFHHFVSPWNTPPNGPSHQVVATSPLATNVHSTTANARIVYQQPQQPYLHASPVRMSPVSISPPSSSLPAPNVPASTVSQSPQVPQASAGAINLPSTLNLATASSSHATSGPPLAVNPTGRTSPSPTKKKRVRRKRCWTCEGCLRKDNCETCSVCTNSNTTNSVCKMRRCDVLKRRPSLVSWIP